VTNQAPPQKNGLDAATASRRRRAPSLTTQIFVGLVAGIAIGHLVPGVGVAIKPLADIFLRMIRMILAPLLFSMLVVGLAGTADVKAVGRIGLKAVVYFQIMTTLALILGAALVNIFQPGAGLQIPIGSASAEMAQLVQRQASLWDLLVQLVPTSVVDAMARGDILQIVVFSTVFGIAVAAIGQRGKPVVQVLESLAQTMFTFTRYVMVFAPIGVMAAIASTIGARGFGILLTLGKFILLLYAGLAIFVLLGIGAVSRLIRVPFFTFLRAIREPLLIGFTTASSPAALPKALEVMERFGAPRSIVGFVLPTGASFNMAGSALYLSMASVFVAQLAGIHLTFSQQLVLLLTVMVTSKGAGGGTRSALVLLTATLSTVGLPIEGVAILLSFDQVVDMGRTALNVMGNCMAAAAIARWEGVFDDRRMRASVDDEAGP
jgi:proton glutamate symport protein